MTPARPIEDPLVGAVALACELAEVGEHVGAEGGGGARLAGEAAEPHQVAPQQMVGVPCIEPKNAPRSRLRSVSSICASSA